MNFRSTLFCHHLLPTDFRIPLENPLCEASLSLTPSDESSLSSSFRSFIEFPSRDFLWERCAAAKEESIWKSEVTVTVCYVKCGSKILRFANYCRRNRINVWFWWIAVSVKRSERIRDKEGVTFPVWEKDIVFCFEDEREEWTLKEFVWAVAVLIVSHWWCRRQKERTKFMPELTAVTTVCCSDDTHWTTQHVLWLFFFGKFFPFSRSFSCCWLVLFSVEEKFFSPRLPADPLGDDGLEEGMLLFPFDATTGGPPLESTRVQQESFVWLLLLTSFA